MQELRNSLYQLDQKLPEFLGIELLVRAIKNNKHLLLYTFAVGFLAYAADIFTFSLNIDSENHAYAFGAKGGWISQGRWGMYFLNAIVLPDSVMPVIPILIAVSGAVVGAVIFMRTLSPSQSMADFFAAPFAVACPVIYFAFYFTTLGYGVGIAFLVASLGVYLISRGNWINIIVAASCFCFGIAVYQAILPLIATMFCLYLISFVMCQPNIGWKDLQKYFLMFMLSMVIAYGLYSVINKWLLSRMEMTFDSGYISGFMSYQLTKAYFLGAVKNTWYAAVDYYTGGKKFYLYDLVSLRLLFFFSLSVTVLRIVLAKSGWLIRMAAILLLLAALAAPMAMHLLNNGYMPPRTVLGVPQVLAALVFFSLSCRSRLVQSITAALAIASLYNFCVINNRYAMSNYMVWQADIDLSLKIQQKIEKVLYKLPPNNDIWTSYPMELVGWVEYQETPVFVQRDVVGASFYKWAAGDVMRIERLFRTMRETRYRGATQAERLSVIEQAKKMPSWPYEGSVDVINGVIVIKLRDYNPNQLMVICRPPYDKDPVCIKNLPKPPG